MLPAYVEPWQRAGLASGHAWAPCDVCDELTMRPRGKPVGCRMTPGCSGTHQPVATPTPLQALRAGLVTVDDVRRHPPADMLDSVVLRRLLGDVSA